MTCNGACEHPGCNIRVPGTAPDARAFAVSGTPAAALEGCAPPIISGGDFGGVALVGCAAPFPHTHHVVGEGGDFAGTVVAGPSAMETFWGNLFGGRPVTMPAPNAVAVPAGFRCERWRNDTDPVAMPPGGQVQRHQGWWRICVPLAPPRPPPQRPAARPKPAAPPKPAAKPAAAKPPPRPPAKPPAPGMTCGPWRNWGAPRAGWTVEQAPAGFPGWWRECRPVKPVGKPAPIAPTPDVEEAKLCAMAPPEEIALTEPDVILWWLTCGERAESDVEALLWAMFDAGRDVEATAILEALGESAVGAMARGVLPRALGGRPVAAPLASRKPAAAPARAHVAAVAKGLPPPPRAARPPAMPPAAGWSCNPWRQGSGPIRTGSVREEAPGFPGWWRECWPTVPQGDPWGAVPWPVAPPYQDPWSAAPPWPQVPAQDPWTIPGFTPPFAPQSSAQWPTAAPQWPAPAPPVADPTEAQLCAMASPEEIAYVDVPTILWWLTCGPRAEADVEALFFAMVAAGRDAEADTVARAMSQGESFVGQLPGWLRTADDAFSSVWDAVKEVVPYGGAIDTLHRARRGLMYGPEAAKPTTAARPATPARRGVGEAIREAQRLVRASRKGDAAATASITRAKVEATRTPEARRRWAVLVATMADHDKRVDALTEGRAPALTASATTSTAARPAPARPAAKGGGAGGGFLGLLGGGR